MNIIPGENARTYPTLLLVFVFSVAMGFFESSVVIYLREIYYPDGFAFPLTRMDRQIFTVELIRELSSLVMLTVIAFMASVKARARLGFFLIAFATWDIFYYLFLKLFLGWPGSLMTWDILFLLPVTWTGPVLAPLINSATMIILGLLLAINGGNKGRRLPSAFEWGLLATGAVVTVTGYVFDYSRYILESYTLKEIFSGSKTGQIIEHSLTYVPLDFPWILFLTGELYFILAIISYSRRNIPVRRI